MATSSLVTLFLVKKWKNSKLPSDKWSMEWTHQKMKFPCMQKEAMKGIVTSIY
jgi:hypothetical protein